MLVLVLALVLVLVLELVLALLGAGDRQHGPWPMGTEWEDRVQCWPGRHGGLNPGCLQETWIFLRSLQPAGRSVTCESAMHCAPLTKIDNARKHEGTVGNNGATRLLVNCFLAAKEAAWRRSIAADSRQTCLRTAVILVAVGIDYG
jgi:hypothetical protein